MPTIALKHWLPAIVLLTAVSAASAQPAPLSYDRVTLSASAQQEVNNDLLVAVLFKEQQGPRQAALADEVNRAVQEAIERAVQHPEVKVQTLGYETSPLYRQGVITGWRVRQSLRLESRDVKALAKLLGELQSQLSLGSVGYEVSPGARVQAENVLIGRALKQFRSRASLIAAALERPGYRIVRLNVATSGPPPRPVLMRSMAATTGAAVAAPKLLPGSQTLRVTVSGTVELEAGH